MAEKVSNNADVQPYIHHLVWLDKNVENDVNQRQLNRLRELDERIRSFTNKDECLHYLREQDERNAKSYIILIVSGSFSEKVIPKVQDCICILAIFIFCTNSDQINHLKSDLVTICTDTNELINRIRSCINQDQTSIDYSLLNIQNGSETTDEQHPIQNLKEDQARFLWFYKCHSFMIELQDDDQQAKEEMIAVCRQNSMDNKQDSKAIKEFEDESLDDNAKNAVYWYTQNSVIARSINEALVSGNIARIYSYRYLIKLLCRQLTSEHKIYKKSYEENTLRLYRGLVLKLSEILRLSKSVNVLISLNGFISTSIEEDVAKRFYNSRKKKDHEPVIFEIDIDMTSEQSIAFANVTDLSRYPDEEEILLSIGSIFRIESVRFDETNQIYRVHLSLRRHDQLTVNEYIEQTFPNECDSSDQSVLFGKLLYDMGEYEFAIEYFKNRIECLSAVDNHHRPTYLNNIGVCYNEIGKKEQALRHYRTASQIYALTNNHRGLGACYHNMANYYYDEKEYDTALQYALKALDERRDYHLEKATTLDLLGCIQLAKHNIDEARDNLREALRIRLKYLKHINPNHPDIGISYQNLGKLDSKSSSYIDAEKNYQRAQQIFRYNYPESHTLMVDITKRLKDIGRRLGN